MEIKPISFLTVTFEPDFLVLERQLKSFDQYMSPGYTYNIILQDDISKLPILKNIVSKYKKFSYNVIHFSELGLDEQVLDSGWHNQQLLKLIAAKIIDTKYYVSFDSKNYVTRPWDPLVDIMEDGYASNTRAASTGDGEFEKYYVNAYTMVGLDPEKYRDQTTTSGTPYVMETTVVLSLLDYLKEQGILLKNLFHPAAQQVTEFYLYTAWATKNNVVIKWRDHYGLEVGSKER
jgi:hypothetical protein